MPKFLSISHIWKYIAAWLVMLLISIANGAARDLIYSKWMNELSAHQVSTAIGVLLLGGVIWLFGYLVPPNSRGQAIALGLFWAGLTITFEFLFFHYFGGHSWVELLANYNVLKGRVWFFVVLWIAAAPYIFIRLGFWRCS
jgi:hypothetical protein